MDKEKVVFAFFCLRSRLDIQGPLQKLFHRRRWHMERFAASRHVAIETVMRKFAFHKRLTVIDAHRIFAGRVLHVFLVQVIEPQFARLVRESTVKGERLVAREINGITLRANPQIKIDNSEGLDF